MLRQSIQRSARQLRRGAIRSDRNGGTRLPSGCFPRQSAHSLVRPAQRLISSSSIHWRGILPDTEDPQPKESAETSNPLTPAEITENEYHELADEYLEAILTKFEELQDTKGDVDVEFAAGVLSLTVGKDSGTYVINKQPPNKQIWLSSPTSGPKRYDWVIQGDGQHQKEGTGVGDWIYIRDGSSLSSLMQRELDVHIETPHPHRGE